MDIDLTDSWLQHPALRYIVALPGGVYRGVPTAKYPTIAAACSTMQPIALYCRPDMKLTKVQMALEMMERDPSITQYRAAQLLGISEAAISRARKLREQRGLCPHCGQLMPPSAPEAAPSQPQKPHK